jgi:hypothetical protein
MAAYWTGDTHSYVKEKKQSQQKNKIDGADDKAMRAGKRRRCHRRTGSSDGTPVGW